MMPMMSLRLQNALAEFGASAQAKRSSGLIKGFATHTKCCKTRALLQHSQSRRALVWSTVRISVNAFLARCAHLHKPASLDSISNL